MPFLLFSLNAVFSKPCFNVEELWDVSNIIEARMASEIGKLELPQLNQIYGTVDTVADGVEAIMHATALEIDHKRIT